MEEKVTYTYALHLSLFLSFSHACVYIVCLYEHVQRDPSLRMLTCGTNLFA